MEFRRRSFRVSEPSNDYVRKWVREYKIGTVQQKVDKILETVVTWPLVLDRAFTMMRDDHKRYFKQLARIGDRRLAAAARTRRGRACQALTSPLTSNGEQEDVDKKDAE